MTEIFPGVPRVDTPYEKYRATAQDCDLLLWSPTGWYGQMIAAATDGPFSHISATLWWEDRLMNVGYDRQNGGYASPLRNAVVQWPGRIHVFRVREELRFDRSRVKARLLGDLGFPYAWSNIRTLALLALPFVRWFATPYSVNRIVAASHATPGGICSQHVARSFANGAGLRFVAKPFEVTTPNDIASSGLCRYVCSLSQVAPPSVEQTPSAMEREVA